MDTTDIKLYFKELDDNSRKTLLDELSKIDDNSSFNLLTIREEQLSNKQGSCPHCGSLKYLKDGHEKNGVQRFQCKSCKRRFTPYTGTWLAKINKKEKLVPYIKLMHAGKSLDKIKDELTINKKTALDWRHKITSALQNTEGDRFKGITESDETFFLYSQKGSKQLSRKARKRGKEVSGRGIGDQQVATIVTMDRAKNIDLKVACLGRITKKDIENAIGERVGTQTVLCTDGHASYKGFAMDNKLEHYVLKANIKQYTRNKVYHIQHVNSAHSRLKTWIDKVLHGVATKYLQDYLSWFRFKEKFKGGDMIKEIIKSALDPTGLERFRNIENEYGLLLQPQNI